MDDLRRKRNAPSLDRRLAKAVEASKAPAISRAIAVLRLLGDRDTPLGVHSIAQELGLAPSTCLYVLRALLAEELVSFDRDTKKYSQEAGVLALARQWLRRNRFTEVAQPAMDRISQAFGVTAAGMHIVDLQHIIVVAVSQSNSSIQLSMQIGSRFPALISATGRCVAAFGGHPEAELEARFRALRWDEPPTFDEWRAQVRRTRAQGFAVDEGNYMSGLTVVGAPVWTRGKLSHALVAVGLSSALKRNGLPKLQKALVSTARILTNQLRGEVALEYEERTAVRTREKAT
jgi:DNA-binding IclR family transcriptional regulator